MVLNDLAERRLSENTRESEETGIEPPASALPDGPLPEIF